MKKASSRLPVLQRALSVREDSLNEEKRTVDLVFATEMRAPMWHPELGDYDEILDCRETAADLTRLRMGGALLSEHDRSKQIGVIETARFENGVGIATARFSNSTLGQQEFQDVKDGIRRNFSVSYQVKELTAESVSEEDGNVYRATSWEPLEVSLVSVPCDKNCQVIRSAAEFANQSTSPVTITVPSSQIATMKRSLRSFFHIADTGANATTGSSPAAPDPAEMQRAVDAEVAKREKAKTENRLALREAATAFKEVNMEVPSDLLETALDNSTPVDGFRSAVIAHFREKNKHQNVGAQASGNVQVVGERRNENLSLGQRFVQSDEFKRVQHARGQGRKVCALEIDEFNNFRATFATSSVTSYNGIVSIPSLITLGLQRPTIADVLTQGTTNLSSVPYLRETAFTNAATAVTEGSLKPEATFALEQLAAAVCKIAVTIPVTDEAFEDIPTLASYIDNKLRYSVEMEEERQLLSGTGASGEIEGLLHLSTVLTQAKSTDTVADAIKKGITKIKTQGFAQPSFIVMHPNDLQDLQLTKDANGQYYGNGPFAGSYGNTFANVERVWGLPVVETTSMTENTALVGTGMDAMIFRKKGLTVDSTNSHASEFTSNIVRLRGEERLAFAIFKPKSFCTVTGI